MVKTKPTQTSKNFNHSTSTNFNPKKDLYLTIYSSIQKHHKLPSDVLSKQSLNYYVSRLKKDGYITRIGYGVWNTLKPYKQVKIVPMVGKHIRGHGFVYKINIKGIKNWKNRITYLDKKNIAYKSFRCFQRIIYKGYKVWLCDNSLVIYVPKKKDYFSKTARGSQKYAIYELQKLLDSLGNYFKTSFKINKTYKFKISRQHYGKIKDALAEQCNRNNEKIHCSYDGKEWLLIDNSKGLNELEAVHSVTAQKDMDKVIVPFMNDLKESYEKTKEVIKPSQLLNMINSVTSNQLIFAENMKSHIEAIQQLSKGVKDFNKEVKGIKKRMEK